jgi:CDP-glycerol glycerophosphotransferase
MDPLLSVVVPFHDVEDYLEECLRSLAVQTLTDLEVIMVDDGSLDGSRLIAKTYAAGDSRFTLLGCENQGPGPARNLGIRAASGRYLAFADGDDVVPPDSYARMVASLERSGSDLACGGVSRLSPEGPVPSGLHSRLFRRRRKRTHITRYPALVKDRTVWNKVYRRSFWDEQRLEFPSGLYEDVPVAMAAHVLATGVDVLRAEVYHWRLRESGATSITQRRTELDNVGERLASLRGVQEFLAAKAPELRSAFDRMVIAWDLGIVATAVEGAEEGERGRLLDLVAPFVDDLDPESVAGFPAIRRLELHLLRRRMVAELGEVRRARQEGLGEVRVVRRGIRTHRWYAAYPFFGDRRRKIPAELYNVTAELALRARVDGVTCDDGRLVLAGHAYIRPFDAAPTQLRLWLVHAKTQRVVPLEAACEDTARFVAVVDRRALPGKRGSWTLHVAVEGPRKLVLEGPVTVSRGALKADTTASGFVLRADKLLETCRIHRQKPG